MLRPYDVTPRTIRLEDGSTPKGYLRDQLLDAWQRWLPDPTPIQPPQAPQASRGATREPHGKADVADVADVAAKSGCGANRPESLDLRLPDAEGATLEDALLDPARAEQIRASVDGEWIDVAEPTRPVWDIAEEAA